MVPSLEHCILERILGGWGVIRHNAVLKAPLTLTPFCTRQCSGHKSCFFPHPHSQGHLFSSPIFRAGGREPRVIMTKIGAKRRNFWVLPSQKLQNDLNWEQNTPSKGSYPPPSPRMSFRQRSAKSGKSVSISHQIDRRTHHSP